MIEELDIGSMIYSLKTGINGRIVDKFIIEEKDDIKQKVLITNIDTNDKIKMNYSNFNYLILENIFIVKGEENEQNRKNKITLN